MTEVRIDRDDHESLANDLDRVRQELRLARRKLQLTLDAAGATCGWDWDIKRRRLVADARFAHITGQDPVELAEGVTTDRFFRGIHPDDVNRVKLAVGGMLSGAEVFSKEYRLAGEDGYRWVHAHGHAIFGADDEPVRFVGNLVDITEQQRIREHLRIAQSAGGVGTFEYNMGFGTLNVSEEFCRLFGLYPARAVPVSTVNALIHRDDGSFIDLTKVGRFRETGNVEFRIRRAEDGEERWLARRGEFVDGIDAEGGRYVGVIFDITEARHTQDRLHKANEELSGVAREREQFIAVLGHDLRNPLASMTSGVKMLAKEMTDPRSDRILRLMGESAQRMGNLIDNVLDFARGRLGSGIGLNISTGERIEPLLARIVNEIKVAHPDREIETDFVLDQPIDVDHARIGQMFSNLLGNAVTHGAPDTPVSVSARIVDGFFELATSNGGEPVSERAMQRLFQPFYRGEVRANQQGLGLGLFIASEIAKAHGGSLEVRSDAAETCFTFKMPCLSIVSTTD